MASPGNKHYAIVSAHFRSLFCCCWKFGCFQCFNTVGWASGRACGRQKLSDEVLVWLSGWSEVQIVCIWSS